MVEPSKSRTGSSPSSQGVSKGFLRVLEVPGMMPWKLSELEKCLSFFSVSSG